MVREEEGGWYVDMQLYCQGCEAGVLATPSLEEKGTVFVTQVMETKEEPLYSDPETWNIKRMTLLKKILTLNACSYKVVQI